MNGGLTAAASRSSRHPRHSTSPPYRLNTVFLIDSNVLAGDLSTYSKKNGIVVVMKETDTAALRSQGDPCGPVRS